MSHLRTAGGDYVGVGSVLGPATGFASLALWAVTAVPLNAFLARMVSTYYREIVPTAYPGAVTLLALALAAAATLLAPVFDRWRLIFIAGLYDGNHGLRTHYSIRTIAIEAGHASSAVSRFRYLIDRRDRTAYVSQEIVRGVRMIRDSDNDKMFLLEGTREFVLIDSGMGRGDLARYIAKFTGAKPLAVIFTHNHGDHIGQAEQFAGGSMEYIGAQDRDGPGAGKDGSYFR